MKSPIQACVYISRQSLNSRRDKLLLQCNAKVCCMADLNFDYMHSLIPRQCGTLSPLTPGLGMRLFHTLLMHIAS